MTKSNTTFPDLAPSKLKIGGGWIVSSTLLAAIALIALAGVGRLRFGSMRAAASFLSGDRLIVDSPERSFGDLAWGDDRVVSFLITNPSSRPLRLLGAKTSCPCVVATGLPLTLRAFERKPIDVRMTRSATKGPFDKRITLYFDEPAVRTLDLRVSGVIVAGPRVDDPPVINDGGRP